MKKTILLLLLFASIQISQTKEKEMTEIEQTAERLATEQLEAYNNRDIDKFLVPFSDSVEIYTFPDELMYKGKEKMRDRYGKMFEKAVNLHCKLTHREVLGNVVIDTEEVTGIIEGEIVNAIAIYTIENDKIQNVHFIK
ncbi:MAG: nuclear transport factor 2 family protein [Chlorobiota bacterium]